jgi:hypothetical protein
MDGAPGCVSIREVCPRDGLQLETPLSFADKARLAATGVRQIDAAAVSVAANWMRLEPSREALRVLPVSTKPGLPTAAPADCNSDSNFCRVLPMRRSGLNP